MKNLSDKIFESSHKMVEHNGEMIFEMSTLSRPVDGLPNSTKICVYDENDTQGTKVPHFHVLIDNGNVELEVEIKHIKELNIWRTKGNHPKSCDGFRNVKKAILNWLGKVQPKMNISNAEFVIDAWNRENPDHEIEYDFWK